MNPKRLEDIERADLGEFGGELILAYKELQEKYLESQRLLSEVSKQRDILTNQLAWEKDENALLQQQINAEKYHPVEGTDEDCPVCTHMVYLQADEYLGKALDREEALEAELKELRYRLESLEK